MGETSVSGNILNHLGNRLCLKGCEFLTNPEVGLHWAKSDSKKLLSASVYRH